MKGIKLIKNRSDIGAGTRGSDIGIDAIEIAAINTGNDYFNRYEFEDVITENESVYNRVKNSFGKQIESVFNQCKRLSNHVKVNLQEGKFPVILSGDHSSALGTISGIKGAFPSKRIGVVWIDAHGDLQTPYTSLSGNIHGMPLGAAINDDNLDCQINQADRETSGYWERMKNISVPGQKVLPEDIIFFGVRDTEEPEDKQIEKYKIKNYTVSEVRYLSLEKCVNEALRKLNNCDIIYISFDVDAMDCDMVSYGTGTPVSKGFDHHEIIAIINKLIKSKKVVCLEFVEINPLLDMRGNKMAETAFEVLNAVTKTIENVYREINN